MESRHRHWAEFTHIVQEGADGYGLVDAARFEVELAEALRSGTMQRALRSGRESRQGEGGAKSVAKRARAGSMRVASLRRARRPMLRQSGVRIVRESDGGAEESARRPEDMATAIKAHWMPVFRGALGGAVGLQPACTATAERCEARVEASETHGVRA